MKLTYKLQLSFLFFLEFFIWGGWFVTMGTFLSQSFNASGSQLAMAYETQSIGAIIAPFIIGLIADRYFAAQKILGVLHLLGAGLLFLAGESNSFASFYPYIFVYMLLYMPTLALVNSVAFHQMKNPSKEFAPIRVLGSLGWIIAGLTIGYLAWESTQVLKHTFYMTSAASALLGIYSFFLPNTPPKIKPDDKISLKTILGLDALALLKDRSYLTFFISSILVCIPLAFYYQHANQFLNEVGMQAAASKMVMGQISEVFFLLLLPVFLNRYGLKKVLVFGVLAWGLRYLLFAFGDAGSNTWMLLFGIILHGICYDFFFVSGQIYTDFKAGEQYKSAAQGLITLATYGVGMLIGFRFAGWLTDQYVSENGHFWKEIWIQPAIFSFVILILFLISFKNETIKIKST
ncbi:MFS transporter [Flavobacteriaceae bacterium]|nr:MFS transporter [Flavobacteriaceae bacterium]MDA9015690.1 MFS transporter [Flavobacteriaceae bacterium]MDA9572370.1 MFS transporter [Flavobacteriaceae bacterium]MDB3862293.1 MFS transporter [Flavobacteriaceae bacterium]MDC3354606.1 MFS transporter [Flavobacteriaceae bacterium]